MKALTKPSSGFNYSPDNLYTDGEITVHATPEQVDDLLSMESEAGDVEAAIYDAFHNMSLHPERYKTFGEMRDYVQDLVIKALPKRGLLRTGEDVCVPRQPTPEIITAMQEAFLGLLGLDRQCVDIYKVMIEAAEKEG